MACATSASRGRWRNHHRQHQLCAKQRRRFKQREIEALAEIICRAGAEAGTRSAALLVLMATLENATHPKALTNMAKHVAFARCGELNLNGMVEAQIAVLEASCWRATRFSTDFKALDEESVFYK